MLVLDTNILVSYALSRTSALGQDVSQILKRTSYACSEATFQELTEVLMREKFDRYFSRINRTDMLERIAVGAKWFAPAESIHDCRDPKDNKFLELAVACHADFLITGDEDLLILNPFRETQILTLSEFASID